MTRKREWSNPIRDPWNSKIHNILQTIDLHNDFYLKSGDSFHHYQAECLREYVKNLKKWIHNQENEE
jgi:hypothetical protein